MPRASDGTYTLPAGNPVTTLTTISSTVHNNTMGDIEDEITASLSRNGDGAMLAALELAAGTVSAPGLSFSAETTTGLYRNASNDIRFSVASTDVLGISTNLLRIDGTAPVLRFDESDATTNEGVVQFIQTGDDFKLQFLTDALAATDVMTFTRTVAASTGVNVLTTDFAVQNASAVDYFHVDAIADTEVTVGDGTSSTSTAILVDGPAATTRRLRFDTAGTVRWIIECNTAAETGSSAGSDLQILARDDLGAAEYTLLSAARDVNQLRIVGGTGSATVPNLGFISDTDTGIYRQAADELAFAEGGTGYRVGFRNVPQNIQNVSYTAVIGDAGKHIYKASGGAGETITIPANSSVAYDIGTVLTIVNQGGGDLTIAITTDTMTLAGTGSTGSRTLADDGIATVLKVTSTSWIISGTGLS